mgnify:CR=1 FL=1
MEESTKILYRELQERYVKVIWTHKIQHCQAAIHIRNNKRQNSLLAFLSCLVSLSAITNILKWLPDVIMIPVLAVLSLILTFFTIKYKADNIVKAASENEYFAATMHDLRNRYAGLLADIKAGVLTNQQIIQRREDLEHDENLIYSGIVPFTSKEAVNNAEKALKHKQDSTTTDEEIKKIISYNLQI